MKWHSNNIKDIRNYFTSNLVRLYDKREANSIAGLVIRHLAEKENASEFELRSIEIPSAKITEAEEILKKLTGGMPVQYALGYTWFYGLRFMLNEATLIPRGETEELVQMIIKDNGERSGEILDIGTGSGSIAISLAANLPLMNLFGWDISAPALEIAAKNSQANDQHVKFEMVDILSDEIPESAKFDIIVSNPPYITESEKLIMLPNVVDYEPHLALFVPDNDPLLFYRNILEKSQKILKGNGLIYFEINEEMGSEMRSLSLSHGFKNLSLIKDINGRERFLKLSKDE